MARQRSSRRTTRTSIVRTRTPTPVAVPSEDEEMVDAPEPTPPVATPEREENEEEDEEGEEEIADDPAENGDAEAEDDLEEVVSEKSSPVIEIIPRKRRLGRPPKNRPPDWDSPRVDDASETTPMKRKRGRPPGGGGARGRPRISLFTGPSKVRVDKEGTLMDVKNDEVDLPDDEEGEKKVDKNGHLLGGREYRVRTFTVQNRGKRLFMLSTEPARCCGFRDSYLFFTKHMRLHKVIVDEDEKRDLIDRDVIPHSYKGRSIGVVTARSVFREFGSRIVVGGKKVTDDYYEQEARDRGDIEGELADPNDRLPSDGQPYNRNQYVAWHGASAVYHTNIPSVPITNGKPLVKRKIQITSANWQFEHARAASRFNSVLANQRRRVWDGTYDPHTNIMHFPKITQPTHAKWEQLPVSENSPSIAQKYLTNGTSNHDPEPQPTIFQPVSKVVARNFLVTDTVYLAPPVSSAGIPGPDGDMLAINHNGLPDVSDDILAELPEDCKAALLAAKAEETAWKESWATESQDGLRGNLKIGFLGFPV